MIRWLKLFLFGVVVLCLVALGIAASTLRGNHAAMPAETEILNAARLPLDAYDIMGRPVSAAEAEALARTDEGRAALAEGNGAVRISSTLLARGRRDFYRETYGSEVYLTDVLGIFDGGLSVARLAIALIELAGRGTADLKVRLARDVAVGNRVFRAGEEISTGLAVPRGGFLPLGVRVFYERGTVKVGATCALCHATVHPASGLVIEGAPNTRLRIGLLLALSSNPAAYFPQTGISTLEPYLTLPDNIVRTTKGPSSLLPDPEPLARDVRTMMAAWPPGSFDSTLDGVNNPTSIPSTFTAASHPYGWSGHAMLGPFRGLWALGNINHGLHVDPISQSEAAPALMRLDPEVYLGTLMQQAPSPAFRFRPRDGRKPSEILWEVDPTQGTPGFARVAVMPSFPRSDYLSAAGVVAARRGELPIMTVELLANRGLPAFQNTLQPPAAEPVDPAIKARGRTVFERAGCVACHSGPAYTSNRVWPASVIRTEGTRARAFSRFEGMMAPPQLFATDTPMPPPGDARLVPVPIPDEGQLKLSWGLNRTGGGYKVPNLLGLRWSAPYLHDGGVAAGPDPDRRVGVAATVSAGVEPDPANSLRALVDRDLREAVVAANRRSSAAGIARVTGEGHTFWVDDDAGFTPEEQDALIAYLLSLDGLDRSARRP